jgi:hypothetical protein
MAAADERHSTDCVALHPRDRKRSPVLNFCHAAYQRQESPRPSRNAALATRRAIRRLSYQPRTAFLLESISHVPLPRVTISAPPDVRIWSDRINVSMLLVSTRSTLRFAHHLLDRVNDRRRLIELDEVPGVGNDGMPAT